MNNQARKKYEYLTRNIVANNVRFLRRVAMKGMTQKVFGQIYEIGRGSVGAYEEGRALLPLYLIDTMSFDLSVSIRTFISIKLNQDNYLDYMDQPNEPISSQEKGAIDHNIAKAKQLLDEMEELKKFFENYNPITNG